MAYRNDLFLRRAEAGRFRGRPLPPSVRYNVVDFNPARPAACPEIDCLRPRFSWQTIARAEDRAAEIGVGADRVLIAQGIIAEEDYIAALAAWLGLDRIWLDQVPREACPLDDFRLVESAYRGLLPLDFGDGPILLVAPQQYAARTVTRLLSHNPELAPRIRLTSTAQLTRFIELKCHTALGAKADRALLRGWPELSAAPRGWRFPFRVAATVIAVIGAFYAYPTASKTAIEIGAALAFLAWLMLRLTGSFLSPPLVRPARIPEARLPVYTIIVALYREAAAVEGLVAGLRELNYPPEKLDIKFVTEADDLETGIALARLELGAPFEVITSPAAGPRTKPKALNAALAFARGTFTAVYDAEDRPEPEQLRRVLDVFLSTGDDLACVQASLTIDNTADHWLARLFTAEYAAQFDLFLPGLAALELPLPLGGSSNHFRTAVLRKVGTWDPYNVTEDADLGVRLARFGYRSTVARSSTYEEAPVQYGAWLRQRTRWFKGWMKTWLVHMRSPRRLFADLGLMGFISFQLVVGGSVLAALIHPLILAGFVYTYVAGLPFLGTEGTLPTLLAALYCTVLGAGYFTSIFLGYRGLARRNLRSSACRLALVPLHWLLLSLAAWRALLQLMRAPQHWEKTEHGLARSSRRARMTRRAALGALFRELSGDSGLRREAAE